MPFRIRVFLVGFVLLFSYSTAEAALVINEIMYDPAGADGSREWLEVFNDGGGDVDFSTYKFFEANTNHGLTLVQGSAQIPAAGFAVIVNDSAAFLGDFPGFSGTIFDSSFSLNNTGEALALKDADGNVINQYTYNSTSGGADDGNSLQLAGGNWSGNMPTPGVQNQASSGGPNSGGSGSETTTTSSSSSSSASKKVITLPATPKLKIISPKTVFTGMSFELQAETNLRGGRFYWNFGDGNTLETKKYSKLDHVYFYEGEYVVTVEYFLRETREPLTHQITIRAVPVEILISKVGDEKDFFVELSNNTNYEMDISGWMLASANKTFIFPRHSIILPKKKLTLSSRVTGLTMADKNSLNISDDTGKLVDMYLSPAPRSKIKQSLVATPAEAMPNIFSNALAPIATGEMLGLSASVLDSEAFNAQASPYKTYLYTTIFIIFIIFSTTSVYFLRRSRFGAQNGEDFELLD